MITLALTTGNIVDILALLAGVTLLTIGAIFLLLFRRHRRRDYLLIGFGLFAAALQFVVDEVDVLFPDFEDDLLSLAAAIFGVITVIFILLVLVYPDRVPIDFEEKLVKEYTIEE